MIDSIEYCKWKYGWMVTVKDFYDVMLKTLGVSEIIKCYINHESEYCCLIKSHTTAFSHCVHVSNSALLRKLESMPDPSAGFVGTCYAGVREFVMPVYYGEQIIGAVIVGSAKCDRERQKTTFDRLHDEFGFERPELERAYESLGEEPNNLPLIQHESMLWAAYLRLLCERYLDKKQLDDAIAIARSGQDPRESKLNQAILYIKNHLTSKITVEQIARECYCSESTIAHLFKQSLGIGVNAFIIQERFQLAKRMLKHTDLPVSEIAIRCGFGSGKYLSGIFRKRENMTPLEYRHANR